MKESYRELLERQNAEINKMNFFFAFGQTQFDKMLRIKGWKMEELQDVGSGMYVRRADMPLWIELESRHREELFNALGDEEFAIQALVYELENHEYGVTDDVTDTLDALAISQSDLDNIPGLSECLEKAIKIVKKNVIF